MKEGINHGNTLIAKFMGAKSMPHLPIRVEEMKYYSSWDWLMPVIQKIEGHRYDDEGEQVDYAYMRTFHSRMVRINRCQLFQADTLLEAAWLAVVDFIECYQKEKA